MSEKISTFIRQFERFETWSDSILSISACHLQTMTTLEYKSDLEFDLCSTYKIPIAVCLLQKVKSKQLDLNTLIDVNEYDLRSGTNSTLRINSDITGLLKCRSLIYYNL